MELARNYSRFFVTLKQERPDYCLDFRPVMGRCIIEIRNGKGKLMAYVQGLKPQVLYKLYLVACTDMTSNGVAVGSVQVDASGKGELKCEFDPDNVNGTGYRIEKFNAVTLMVPKNGEIAAPLVGYFENPVMWKNNFTFFKVQNDEADSESKEKVSDGKTEEKIDDLKKENDLNDESENSILNDTDKAEAEQENKEEAETSEISDEPDSDDIVKEEAQASEKDDKLYKQNINEINDENGESLSDSDEYSIQDEVDENKDNSDIGLFQKQILSENNDDLKKNIDEIDTNINNGRSGRFEHQDEFKDIVGRFRKEMEELKYYTEMQEMDKSRKREGYSDTGDNNIDYMFAHNAQMQPFRHPDADTEWIRVSPNELSAFPGDFYKYINNPFVCAAYKKYKHLMMGRKKKDGKWCYILGIPEKYIPSYKLDASFQKFNKFRCCDDNKPIKGSYGYWLTD